MSCSHALPWGIDVLWGEFPQRWLGRVGDEIQLPWASATLFASKNSSIRKIQFSEELPIPLGCQRRGALSEVSAKRQGRVAGCGRDRWDRDALEEGGVVVVERSWGWWGRQSMLGPVLAGDSSWWQAPPLLGGECLPFVSWPVNSLSPYLTSSICSQPSILPAPSWREGSGQWGERGDVPVGLPDAQGGQCLLYQTRSKAFMLKRSCLAGDILCPWGPVSNSS